MKIDILTYNNQIFPYLKGKVNNESLEYLLSLSEIYPLVGYNNESSEVGIPIEYSVSQDALLIEQMIEDSSLTSLATFSSTAVVTCKRQFIEDSSLSNTIIMTVNGDIKCKQFIEDTSG